MNSNESSGASSDGDAVKDFDAEAQADINDGVVPFKSAYRYKLVYETFLKMKDANKANSLDGNVLVCYFKDLQKKFKSNSVWSVCSTLEKTLILKHKLDINKDLNLKAILKNFPKGYSYRAKKFPAFSWDNIMKFMNKARDDIYLAAKVFVDYIKHM